MLLYNIIQNKLDWYNFIISTHRHSPRTALGIRDEVGRRNTHKCTGVCKVWKRFQMETCARSAYFQTFLTPRTKYLLRTSRGTGRVSNVFLLLLLLSCTLSTRVLYIITRAVVIIINDYNIRCAAGVPSSSLRVRSRL